MGNHRFRLSDMMPNAWFYKLKDMNKPHRKQSTKKTNTISPKPSTAQKASAPPLIPNRASYYFPSNSPIHPKANDTHFPLDSPRKSTRMPQNRKPTAASSSSLSSSCRGSLSLSVSESESDNNNNNNCCICKKVAPSSADIVLDIGSELELRPIITKPIKKQEQDTDDIKNSPARRSVSLRSRANTPTKKVRIAARSSGNNRRRTTRGIAESFAVVKSSSDPKRDFKESMMEMILENDLKTAKELEELLACYLSLNANEYHDVIVKVFGEIWFDIIRK